MHRIFYFPEPDGPLAAGARALCYANFHGCFFVQAGDLDRASQHLALGDDQATIFHLTAEDGVLGTAGDARTAHDRCQRFVNALEAFVAAGGRLVWSAAAETTCGSRMSEHVAALRDGLGELAHLVHCSSFATAEAIHTTLNVDWRKLVVVPPGSYRPMLKGTPPMPAGAHRAQTRDRLGLAPEQRLLVHVGRAHPQAGIDRLLASWRRMKPADATLMLLGPLTDDPGRDEITGLRAAGVHVETGARTVVDLAGWIEASDLVVLPHRRPLGDAELILALSCGRPALIPAWPSLLELVTPGREALTYDPDGDDAAFTACLEAALAHDRDTLGVMGAHAATRAEAMSWRMLGRQLADSFLRVAAGGLPAIPALEPAATAPGAIKPRLVR